MGADFRTYIERTILRPLRVNDTYWPAPGELSLRGTHARNYGVHPAHPEAGRMDVTELPGYEFGASGGLVLTPGDLNAFWDGLLGGRLLPGDSVAGGRATSGRGTMTVYTTRWAAEGETPRHRQGAVDAALCGKSR
ncbi:serine hydrolase [Streptomyces violaceusniger]|uniref:serine hydrolase n=1 Tax=Streptomyces violaceusniger TaxID=68280 RepID=UPI003420E9D3